LSGRRTDGFRARPACLVYGSGRVARRRLAGDQLAEKRPACKLGQFYDDAGAPSGLKATQQGLLYQIHATGAPTMGEIAAALIMDLSALGHTLKPLMRDGNAETSPTRTIAAPAASASP
jgi:hypothetical protein